MSAGSRELTASRPDNRWLLSLFATTGFGRRNRLHVHGVFLKHEQQGGQGLEEPTQTPPPKSSNPTPTKEIGVPFSARK